MTATTPGPAPPRPSVTDALVPSANAGRTRPRDRRTYLRILAVLAVATAVVQISVPLLDDESGLDVANQAVVCGFAAIALLLVMPWWGVRRAVAALVVVVAATWGVEQLGVATGLPFGDYHYTDRLADAAGVPIVVPMAWFAMGITALEVGHRLVPGHHAWSRAGAVAIGALGLTAWDLFLDPQMVENGYWEWADGGHWWSWTYQDIPASNYVGWLLTGLVVLAAIEGLRPAVRAVPAALWLYTWWTVMNTIGFAVFFGRPFVAVVGGLGMGAVCLAAWARTTDGRSRREPT